MSMPPYKQPFPLPIGELRPIPWSHQPLADFPQISYRTDHNLPGMRFDDRVLNTEELAMVRQAADDLAIIRERIAVRLYKHLRGELPETTE